MPVWSMDIGVGATAIVLGHDVALGAEGNKGRNSSVSRPYQPCTVCLGTSTWRAGIELLFKPLLF